MGGILAAAGLICGAWSLGAAEGRPEGLAQRVPWTTSRVVGSPEPPSPYTVERTLTNLVLKAPIYVVAEPGTDQLVIVQQGGESERPSRVLRVRDDPAAERSELLLEMKRRLIYSVAFHPGYLTNGWLWVFSNGPTGEGQRTNRISRFRVARSSPQACDAASEETIIDWRSAGHDGGEMVFGRDGMLYVSSGDGTSDSDTLVTGQDVSDLLGGVLRIDVEHPDPGRRYGVPRDNPFVDLPGARPELWAYGLRNPWRMTVDRRTGHIWVGNNGQDLWESAHFLRRGENYGWSVYEGGHPFYLHRKRGPTPPVAPTLEHHHAEFRSLTGGVVYYGEVLPDLNGVYVYGDYSTGKIWGGRHDGERLTWQGELTDTTLQIAGFGVGHRGDLLVVDHGGGLYRVVPRRLSSPPSPFPARLSETGLFVSVRDHRVEPALIPYSVNAPGWVDGARVERWLALPGETQVGYASSGSWNWPDGTVLMQTLSLDLGGGGAAGWRRVETRLLTRQGGEWAGYSYRWEEDQSDGVLVGATGENVEFAGRPSGPGAGGVSRTWRFPSRSECMACHSRAANFVLGLTERQMNREHKYGGVRENQLQALQRLGVLEGRLPKPPGELSRLADPYDTAQDLEARARAYLHANCSVCHVEAGGGNASMELGHTTPRERMRVLGARPQHDTFGIANAMLIAPGEPERSVLYQRVARRGRGQMPPLVSAVVDEGARQLLYDWIKAMTPEQKFVRAWTLEDLLPLVGETRAARSFEAGRTAFRQTGCVQCHRFAGEGGSVGPDLTGVSRRLEPRAVLESIVAPSKVIAPEYASTEVELVSGETVTGRIEHEDALRLVLRPAGVVDAPVTVAKAEVRTRGVSAVSNMPSDMLDVLEREQILDLLAYLLSDGQRDHPAFREK